jgi:hypothetical protein
MANLLQNIVNRAFEAVTATDEEREASRLLAAYRKELHGKHWNTKPQELAAGAAILAAPPRIQALVVIAMKPGEVPEWRLNGLKTILTCRDLPWTAVDMDRLLDRGERVNYWATDWDTILRVLKRFTDQGNALAPSVTAALRELMKSLEDAPGAHVRKLQARLTALLGEENSVLPDRGDGWAEAALADIALLPNAQQAAWKRLFAHAQNSESSKPTKPWRKAAASLVEAVGEDEFRLSIERWFALVTVPPMRAVQHEYAGRTWENQQSAGSDRNISLLKGLAWMCADLHGAETARAVARLVEGCLRKQPGTGPWASRAASAGIWALTEMEGAEAVGQLGRLKTKVTFRPALKAIEQGLASAAARAGVTTADLEDLSVPAYGFAQDGTRREEFGECAATATLTSTGDITVAWFGANGKPVKSPPAAVKKEFAAELKAFKADVDAAGKMLTAQKARFDGFYLPERTWTYRVWEERFRGHPILGNIARRLIWHFAEANDGRKAQGIWSEARGGFVDARGEAIEWLGDDTEVRLWHPIGFAVEDVLAWRNYVQNNGIVQPFKQAYREVYLLTEAELRTGTYSNRFAGHILKQHQMQSLAALRGWRSKLRMLVDDVYPPATREIGELGLRAEFWIEGAGDNYGTDTTDSGAYLYLTTDQVRFYRVGAPENYAHAGGGGYSGDAWGRQAEPSAPLPLTEAPALAFSEIMRDVDLFVGVCSVGNDPSWQDGGPRGLHQDYWASYSFGELSATAQTRHAVLERLLPRLKIAERCSLTDRFLIVRGDLRTYKIHLGSANILMEPNDQYLCIVQDRSAGRSVDSSPFLPFEGDQRLALILSKAFLLADDRRITDQTITRQIAR